MFRIVNPSELHTCHMRYSVYVDHGLVPLQFSWQTSCSSKERICRNTIFAVAVATMKPWIAASVPGHFPMSRQSGRRRAHGLLHRAYADWRGPCLVAPRGKCASHCYAENRDHTVHTFPFSGQVSIKSRSFSCNPTTKEKQPNDESQVSSRTTDGYIWPNLYQEARGMAMGT